MKKILLVLFYCSFTNILNAFEYYFPDYATEIIKTNITYDKGEILPFNNFRCSLKKVLEIEFETQSIGHESILAELGKLNEAPKDYNRLYEILKRYTSYARFTKVNYETFFPGAVVGWFGHQLQILDGELRYAIKRLKIGEERSLLKIRIGIDEVDYLASLEKELENLNIPHIKIQIEPIPSTIIMKCNRIDKQSATCWFTDENNNKVEKLVAKWNISYPENLALKLKQEIKETKQAQAKRKQLLEKECPSLYRTLYNAQRGYYVDPIQGVKAARRFDELGCQEWVQM